jgi:hypothetical protein
MVLRSLTPRLPVEVVGEGTTRIAVDLSGNSALKVKIKGVLMEFREGVFVDLRQQRVGFASPVKLTCWAEGSNEIDFRNLHPCSDAVLVSSSCGQSIARDTIHLEAGEVGTLVVDLSVKPIPIRVEDGSAKSLVGVSAML